MATTSYTLRDVPVEQADIALYGGVRQFVNCLEPECLAVGPAETGKTLGALWKLHSLALMHKGGRFAIVRKSQKSTYTTVLKTFEEHVLKRVGDAPVRAAGGIRPFLYQYSTGSEIDVAGMDNSDRILSSEYDVIYVNQAEELTEKDWETLTTRCTGRAGHMPYAQCIGDCNPSHPSHWILKRQKAGSLELVYTTHKDNPTLWDHDAQQWTRQGERTLGVLGNLTGALRARLLEGQWAQEEGAVYDEFNRAVHVLERDASEFRRYVVGVDEGYTNPAALVVFGLDGDGRMHAAEEFYETGMRQDEFVDLCRRVRDDYGDPDFYVDPSAAGLIAAMQHAGLTVHAGKNAVYDGIQMVKRRLAVQDDGRPRLTVSSFCTNMISEFETYRWREGNKDVPVKENEHAMDASRYAVMGLQVDTRVRHMPSPYDPIAPDPIVTTREMRAREYADTDLHRRWAHKNFCLDCYNEHQGA